MPRCRRNAAAHGVTAALLDEVAQQSPKLFPNEGQGRSGNHLLIGPAVDGRFWTIVVLELMDGVWRPITGWPSTGQELRLYREELG